MRSNVWNDWKFPLLMSAVTTFTVTFVLVAVNYGWKPGFLFIWMRSWLLAGVLVALSIRFVGPRLRRLLDH